MYPTKKQKTKQKRGEGGVCTRVLTKTEYHSFSVNTHDLQNNNRVTQYFKLPCVKNGSVVQIFPGS